jgi:hypothetical protein
MGHSLSCARYSFKCCYLFHCVGRTQYCTYTEHIGYPCLWCAIRLIVSGYCNRFWALCSGCCNGFLSLCLFELGVPCLMSLCRCWRSRRGVEYSPVDYPSTLICFQTQLPPHPRPVCCAYTCKCDLGIILTFLNALHTVCVSHFSMCVGWSACRLQNLSIDIGWIA